VWGDSTNADVASTENDQFVVRANGGVYFRDSHEMRMSDTDDALLVLEADTDDNDENDNPGILFSQDGGVVTGFVGYEEGTNRLSLENSFSGTNAGVYIYTNAARTAGSYLAAGGSTWTSVSDRAMKDNIRPVNVRDVLNRLSSVPISRWNYKAQDPEIEHMGPMAQDFYAAFGLGIDDKHINTIDPDGVALAAIQGLYELVKEKQVEANELKAENTSLKQRLDEQDARLKTLETIVSSLTPEKTE
jgi:hypothetical protein